MIRHGLVTPDNGEVVVSMICYFVVLLPLWQLFVTHTWFWFNQTSGLELIDSCFSCCRTSLCWLCTWISQTTFLMCEYRLKKLYNVHLKWTQKFPCGESLYINSKITLTQCHNQEKRKNFMTVAKWQRAIISMSLKQPEYWLKSRENKETINKLLIMSFSFFFDASGHSLEVKYILSKPFYFTG